MNRIQRILLPLLFLCVALPTTSGVMPEDTCSYEEKWDAAVSRFRNDNNLRNAQFGVCVMDLSTGSTLTGCNIDKSLVPASTMKVVTSASALRTLRPDYRFRTLVKHSGEIDASGVIQGNLIIEGGMDPTLGSYYFPDLTSFVDTVVTTLRKWNITGIRGQVIAEEQISPIDAVPSKWMDEDIAETYGAGVHSLNYADNLFSLIIDTSGGRVRITDTVPHIRTLTIDNNMRAGSSRSGRYSPVAHRKKHSDVLVLNGTLRRMNDPIELVTPAPRPSEGLCADIRETLEAEGIFVENQITNYNPEESYVLLDYKSPALEEIVRSLLVRSDNMYAESVLRAVGQRKAGNPSRKASVDAEVEVLEDWGIDLHGMTVYDGSGLSRSNKVTPLMLAKVLRASYLDMASNSKLPSLLPVAGEEGTVKYLLRGTPLAGHISLKSGSMRGIRCYAGYYPTDAPKYAVVVMVNNFRCGDSRVKTSIERLLSDMFIENGEPIELPKQPLVMDEALTENNND